MKDRRPAKWPTWLIGICLLMLLLALPAWAEQTSANGAGTRSTTARLDFLVQIERMLFLRVGTGGAHTGGVSGAGPAANATVESVNFTLSTVLPAAAAVPANGNNQAVAWNGVAPTWTSGPGVALPVEVRSNAGPVVLSASVIAPLAMGPTTLPMSGLSISSNLPLELPAPVVPNSGTGATVAVATGGTGTTAAPALLTYRSAVWTFSYTPGPAMSAGVYSGQVGFTASAP